MSLPILFLTEDRALTPDGAGGGAALAFSRLSALAHAGYDVRLVHITQDGTPQAYEHFCAYQPDVAERIDGWVEGHEVLQIGRAAEGTNSLVRSLRSLKSPLGYESSWITPSLRQSFRDLVQRIRPALIWAEHLRPAVLAVDADVEPPVVYSHHDWKWRIKSLRTRGSRSVLYRSLHYGQIRRAEEALVRRVAACVSGSATEAVSLRKLGVQKVGYFPTTYPQVEIDLEVVLPRPRLVHLGGMQTTSSREGLQRFLDVVWPEVARRAEYTPELWVVGSMTGATRALRSELGRIGAVCTGYVEDLRTVLRPYDLHIIPWEYDTGTRTRLPTALNHGQVVLAVAASVACMPEAQSGVNCVLVDRLEDMADPLMDLLQVPAERERLGRAARHTFEQTFTREMQQAPFNAFLESCISEAHARSVS